MRMRLSFLSAAAMLLVAQAAHGKEVATSTCAIWQNPQAYDGALVVLTVTLEATAHGIVLYEEVCPLSNLSWDFMDNDPRDPSLQALIKEAYKADNYNIHHPEASTRAVIARITGRIILVPPYPNQPSAPYFVAQHGQIIDVRPVRLWSDYLMAKFPYQGEKE